MRISWIKIRFWFLAKKRIFALGLKIPIWVLVKKRTLSRACQEPERAHFPSRVRVPRYRASFSHKLLGNVLQLLLFRPTLWERLPFGAIFLFRGGGGLGEILSYFNQKAV